MRIWIDTDIGGDIDDALTVLLALADSKVELVGISTVFENTSARAQIAKKLVMLGGKGEVPVYAGIGRPIKATTVHRLEIKTDNLPKTYLREAFASVTYDGDDGVERLRDAVEREEGTLNIVTLGALTNIAELIGRYPETAKKINCLYIMGGARELNLNEFNFTCDPEAADRVLSSDIPKRIITLDVTFQCKLTREQIRRLKNCKSALVKIVMGMNERWGSDMILHDPLTLAVALHKGFVEFLPSNLKVELEGHFSRGKCIDLCNFNWQYPPKPCEQVSASVNKDKVLNYYVDAVCAMDERLCR